MTQYTYDSNVPAPAGRNGLALWAMILGIAALVLSVGVVGGVLGLVAAILGIVGLVKPGRKGMAIVGLVTGVVSMGVAFIALLFWVGFVFARTGMVSAKESMAHAELSNVRSALMAFEVDNGRYPTTEEGLDALVHKPAGMASWTAPYMDRLPLDPWGRTYMYRAPGTTHPDGFDLYSVGPDGKDGTGDDIDSQAPPGR